EKTMEDVCDVFLWPDGDFVFQSRGPVIKDSVVINLDPIHLVFEGIRRNELWSRLNAVIHPGNLFERSSEFMDDKGAWEDVRVAKHVFVHLDGNVTVADLVERLPFSRYKIYRAVSELLERRLLVHSDLTAAADGTQARGCAESSCGRPLDRGHRDSAGTSGVESRPSGLDGRAPLGHAEVRANHL
ncbi:MAG: hypothetical protein ABIO78_00710, partial [Thermoanaerobaculia bacterium]